MGIAACSDTASEEGPVDPPSEVSLSEQNLRRAIELTDNAVSAHFTGDGIPMYVLKKREVYGCIPAQ
jgi:hypothetical protein